MEFSQPILKRNNNLISVNELKSLLITITDHQLNICFRYRLLGEMWQTNFMRIVKVTELGVLLGDEIRNRLVSLRDLSQVMQFELDSCLHAFQPHFHYGINPYSL